MVASLRLDQKGRVTLVPSEDVVAVSCLVAPRTATHAGVVIGAIVDAILVSLFASIRTNS